MYAHFKYKYPKINPNINIDLVLSYSRVSKRSDTKMWRLRIGATAGDKPDLCTTNNFLGRQIWEFDVNAGSPEELAEIVEARQNFSDNRSNYKASADQIWRMQVKRKT